MSYYLIVFRARSETMKFSSIISSYGVPTNIVNTPRQISVACGISVKIPEKALSLAQDILKRRQFYTCAGVYLEKNDNYIKV